MGKLQESYNTWVDEVVKAINHMTNIKTKNPRKYIQKVHQISSTSETKVYQKKTTKGNTVRKSENPEKAHHIQTKREQSKKFSKIAESKKNNVDNGRKI